MMIAIYAFFSLGVLMAIGDVFTTSNRGAIVFEVAWVLGIVGSGLWRLLAEPRRVEVHSDGLRSSRRPGRSSSRGKR